MIKVNGVEQSYELFPNNEIKISPIKNDRNNIYVELKYENSIDIVRKGCSKGTGIKIIKDYYHLEKVAGIGDSYNDLPMLKVVDTAFTFKTSPQEIQKQVHYCVNDIAEAIALLEVEK